MYIYPDHLKARATMWLWELKDLAVIGTGSLVSVFALAQFSIFLPLVLTAVYGFLTIRVEDASIMDFIRYACTYLFLKQQYYEWRHPEG